jgi:protein TonB
MAARFGHLLGSLVAHGSLFALLGRARPVPPVTPLPPRTEFVPVELPPPEPPPPPEDPPETEPALPAPAPQTPLFKPAPRLQPLESSAVGGSEAAVQVEDVPGRTPLRLTGVSLSNALPNASAFGSTPKPGPKPAPPKPPTITPVTDLSRRPVPPKLDASLTNHYPPELRRRGIDGEALVRVHISPAGHVTRVEPVSQSAPEFSSACRQTLLGTEWSAPLDQSGAAVPTELLYRCRFRVGS